MATYAVTGGSSGIGAKTVQLLKQKDRITYLVP